MRKRVYLDEKVNRAPDVDPEYYENSFKDLINFCKIIKKQDPSDQTLMKNWVIVRLVSLLEYHLKASISDLIDELDINPRRILKEDSILIDLNVLQHFKSEQYTKGRIIIAHFDKMNANSIKIIMDRINRLDYYEWYNSLVSSTAEDVNDTLVQDLYKKRNDVIHNMIDVEYSVSKIKDYVDTFKQFGLQLIFLTKLNIGIEEVHWTDAEAMEHCESLNVPSKTKFLRDFRKTTKKFRKDYLTSSKRH